MSDATDAVRLRDAPPALATGPPNCCIAYTTDEAYLFPTLVSAMQARRHASAAKADVVIFHFSISDRAERDFTAIGAMEQVRLIAVDPRTIEGASPMLARLFLNRFVPAQYDQFLYLDGDVQIQHPIDPLIAADVPPGRFLAANDPMTFMLGDRDGPSRDLAAHLHMIGLDHRHAEGYFNTGVLRIARAGWDVTGARAWKLVRDSGRPYRFPDQDPLNLVAADARLALSLAWNFPIFMRNARVEPCIRPRILHYMSNPKPWQGVFAPWGAAAFAAYARAVSDHPALAPYSAGLPLQRRVRYHVQQRYKQMLEAWTWGHGHRRKRILRYEAGALRFDHG